MERHAKLQQTPTKQSVPTVKKATTSFSSSKTKFKNPFHIDSDNPLIHRFIKRVLVISVAFLLISPLVPLSPFITSAQGYEAEGELDAFAFTNQETESVLADIMTQDGFLLKPGVQQEVGDRSTANEIFSYTVKPGDTISSIAQRFGVKKETIVMANDLWNSNRLRSGTVLSILPVDGIPHKVKKGETLAKIAKKYKVEIEDIVRQNQLIEDEALVVSAMLIVPGAKKARPVAPKPTYTPKPSTNTAPNNPGLYQGQAGTGRLIWPTLGAARLTQGFHRGHYALDIANRAKGPIFAAASGKVVTAKHGGWNGGYGTYIIIDHGNGMKTLYAHNEKLYVNKGDYVEQGQTIAWMGNTGRVYGATGIHLHFEVRINGVKYNPNNFF